MKKIIVFILVLVFICFKIQAQSLSVKTSLTQGSSAGAVVTHGGTLHALTGADVTYTISLSTTDSIANVTKFDYIFNGSTKAVSYSLSKGSITINPVTESNLKETSSNVTFECSMTYVTKRDDKDTTIVVSAAQGDPIRIYANPTYSVSEPKNYVYCENVYGCIWQVSADGGAQWKYKWTSSDGGSSESSLYTYSGTNTGSSKKTVTISLSMTNYAPDGKTVWGTGANKQYNIEIYPKITVSVSPSTNYSFSQEELFQDQTWELAVNNSGGFPEGWTYEWKDESGNIVGNGKTYTMSSERSKQDISKQVSLKIYNKGKLSDGSEETWYSSTTYTWYAKFIPCPIVEFDKKYPSDMIYGDQITLGFVISDDDGNSLLDNSKYNWSYSWNYSGYTYYNRKNITISADNNYNNDGDYRTVTLNVSGKLENGKTYTTTRTHDLRMWPTPKISRPSNSPVFQDACGGQIKQLGVTPIGGVKSGWRYTWYKNRYPVYSGESNIFDADIVYNAEDFSTSEDSYSVIAENYCEGVLRYQSTMEYSITKYPQPVISETLNLFDSNRGKNIEVGIREGNILQASITDCYGGYWEGSSDHWEYLWYKDNQYYTQERRFDAEATMNSKGDNMATSSQSFSLNVYNWYSDGSNWANNTIQKDITVYRRPSTPTALMKKGNGTSCTFIAQSSISDTQLAYYDYYMVFGFTDANGVDHPQKEVKQETGTTRFDSFNSSDFNNINNIFWVYSLWKYADGPYITSGKRYINSVDENWDGSAYTPSEISSRATDDVVNGIEELTYDCETTAEYVYTLTGKKIPYSQAKTGVFVVNGKKVLVK